MKPKNSKSKGFVEKAKTLLAVILIAATFASTMLVWAICMMNSGR